MNIIQRVNEALVANTPTLPYARMTIPQLKQVLVFCRKQVAATLGEKTAISRST